MKIKSNRYFEISAYDLEKLFKEHFDMDYEIVPEEELHNGVTVFWNVGKERKQKYFNLILKGIEDWKNGIKYAVSAWELIDLLSMKGIIPAGNYLVDHSW